MVSTCGGEFSVRFRIVGLGQWSHMGGRCKPRLLTGSEIGSAELGQRSYIRGFGKRGMLAGQRLGARRLVLRLRVLLASSMLLGPFRCLAARTCELRASCAVCLCMHWAVYYARYDAA